MISYAFSGLVLGILLAWFSLRRGRRPQQFDITTTSWAERPVPLWQQDRFHFTFIVVHSLSVASLAVMFLRDTLIAAPSLASTWTTACALTAVWIIAGSLVAFPLIYRVVGTMPMFVFTNAVARGQYLADWSCFSYFQADPATRIIRLYSARTSEVVRAAWQPPTEEIFKEVRDVLTVALPSQRPAEPPAWYWRRATLLCLLAGTIMPFLVGGLLISGTAWSWVYYFLAAFLVTTLATVVIRLYQLD